MTLPQAPALPLLERALLALDAACDGAVTEDGQGFNGRDTGYGKDLAAQVRAGRRLSLRQREAATKMLRTYRKQLAHHGIDYAALAAEEVQRQATVLPLAPLVAQQPGPCARCGRQIAVGQEFAWGIERGQRVHRVCPAVAAPTAPPATAPADDGYRPDLAALEALCAASEDGEAPDYLDGPQQAAQPTSDATGAISPGSRALLTADGPLARALPGYQPRPGQLQMVDAADAAIAQDAHLVVHAPTGTGKSVAYLVPASRSGRPVIVATAVKALQEQLAEKDLPMLRAALFPDLSWAVLKGRANYVCKARLAEIERDGEFPSPEAAAAWPAFRAWLADSATGDVDGCPDLPGDLRAAVTVDSDGCTGQACPFYGECYGVAAVRRAEQAQVTIVNYALLWRDLQVRAASDGHVTVIPAGRKPRRAEGEADADYAARCAALRPPILICDECHNVEDTATDALGVEIGYGRWHRALSQVERLAVQHKALKGQRALDDTSQDPDGARVAEWQERAAQWSVELVELRQLAGRTLGEYQARLLAGDGGAQRLGDERSVLGPLARATRALADRVGDGAPAWLDAAQRARWERLGEQLARLAEDVDLAATPRDDGERVRYAELARGGDGQVRAVLYVKPIEVADALRGLLWGPFPCVIACSATVAENGHLGFWRSRVGCGDGRELLVASPFDYARQGLIYQPAEAEWFDPSAARDRHQAAAYYDRLAERCGALIDASGGGAFLLFHSAAALREVHQRLELRLSARYRVLVQGGRQSRAQILDTFKADGNAVLFGLKTWWEGVDVPGQALRLVVINAMPFTPPTDPVFAARKEAITRRTRDRWAWWDSLAVPLAILPVQQAVGRLHRTVTDRGVIALLDGRLQLKRYGERVLRSLPPCPVTNDLEVVRAFFTQP